MTEPVEDEIDVGQLGPLRQLGSEGQATVFELRDDPNGLVYKEYPPNVRENVQVSVLRRFVTFARSLDEPDRERLTARAAWPLTVVRRDGVVSGFLRPRTPRGFTVTPQGLVGFDSVPAESRHLTDQDYLRDRGRWIDDEFRLRFLRDTAETLALLHRLGIAVGGDWSRRLLFSDRVLPRCFFVDCDTMWLGENTVLATPTDGQEEPAAPAGDCYQLGLLALRIFTGDQNESDPAKVTALPETTRDVVTASLRADPAQRPDAQSWLKPMDIAMRHVRAAAPTPAVERPRGRKPAWLAGLSAIIGLITLVIRLSNLGSSTTTVSVPVINYLPDLPSQSLDFPTPEGSDGFSTSPCDMAAGTAADPTNPQEKAVLLPLNIFMCALNADEFSATGAPNVAQSRANFEAFAPNAAAGSLALEVTSVQASDATTLKANTAITNGSQCWTMAFVLNQDSMGDYTIFSIGPALVTRCS
jgi:hypothetical protein